MPRDVFESPQEQNESGPMKS